jgi:hypothetical protein
MEKKPLLLIFMRISVDRFIIFLTSLRSSWTTPLIKGFFKCMNEMRLCSGLLDVAVSDKMICTFKGPTG